MTVGLGILALPFAAGCAGSDTAGSADTNRPAAAGQGGGQASAPTYTIEQLATTLGCKPQFRGKFKDYRQAMCETKSGQYVLNTFDTAKGQKGWLDISMWYGGTYLIGTRWVIVASPQLLKPLRGRLGGQIQTGSDMSRQGSGVESTPPSH